MSVLRASGLKISSLVHRPFLPPVFCILQLSDQKLEVHENGLGTWSTKYPDKSCSEATIALIT